MLLLVLTATNCYANFTAELQSYINVDGGRFEEHTQIRNGICICEVVSIFIREVLLHKQLNYVNSAPQFKLGPLFAPPLWITRACVCSYAVYFLEVRN
jgi:hypothetical protein